jgi:hypothetical protein
MVLMFLVVYMFVGVLLGWLIFVFLFSAVLVRDVSKTGLALVGFSGFVLLLGRLCEVALLHFLRRSWFAPRLSPAGTASLLRSSIVNVNTETQLVAFFVDFERPVRVVSQLFGGVFT